MPTQTVRRATVGDREPDVPSAAGRGRQDGFERVCYGERLSVP
ncbi:hypothetical protein [Mycolicibacterium monacense]|nr:hypothetical protein [Mycolicibacterium monacense]